MYQIYLHNDGYPFPQCINFTLTTMGGNAFLGCHDAIIVVLGQVTMIGIRGAVGGGHAVIGKCVSGVRGDDPRRKLPLQPPN